MTSLKLIEIPTSVTYIGDHCFDGCSKLKEILVEDGNPKLNKKGQIQYSYVDALDINGNLIPELTETEIYINEDWNILDYVKTDYNELKEEDFVKTLLDYGLFSYMKENNLLFDEDEDD